MATSNLVRTFSQLGFENVYFSVGHPIMIERLWLQLVLGVVRSVHVPSRASSTALGQQCCEKRLDASSKGHRGGDTADITCARVTSLERNTSRPQGPESGIEHADV